MVVWGPATFTMKLESLSFAKGDSGACAALHCNTLSGFPTFPLVAPPLLAKETHLWAKTLTFKYDLIKQVSLLTSKDVRQMKIGPSNAMAVAIPCQARSVERIVAYHANYGERSLRRPPPHCSYGTLNVVRSFFGVAGPARDAERDNLLAILSCGCMPNCDVPSLDGCSTGSFNEGPIDLQCYGLSLIKSANGAMHSLTAPHLG